MQSQEMVLRELVGEVDGCNRHEPDRVRMKDENEMSNAYKEKFLAIQ